MIRSVTCWCVLGLAVSWVHPSVAFAQALPRHLLASTGSPASPQPGELHGVVTDAAGHPLTGAMVSAHGGSFAFQVSDRHGRFSFRDLPPGAYLLRVHLDGYVAPRGRYIQVAAAGRHRWTLTMARSANAAEGSANAAEDRPVLEAGVGGTGPPGIRPGTDDEAEDESELAWRLRHLTRGVLKEAQNIGRHGPADLESLFERAAGSPGRLAAALFADLSLNGQVNFMTITSFDRPEDLFSVNPGAPRPVAYLSLVAPGADGEWSFRGAATQGEISSWMLAGSYARYAPAAHRYEAGFSYSTQRYEGGNVDAMAAMREGSRNVGEVHASDVWTVSPQWTVAAWGRYATYGYLEDRDLVSGRLAVEFQPSPDDPLRLSVSAAHREIAPGAEEFVPPAAGPGLPPERTFSHLSRGTLNAERVDHLEIAGEREVGGAVIVSMRAFRQQVADQLVTVFGAGGEPSALGHYHVSSGGDFDSYGWGVGLRRPIGIVQASVDYTQVDARQHGLVDTSSLIDVAPAVLRDAERIHDLTATVNTRVPQTATRLLLVYKLNNAYAAELDPVTAARFEVQVNQEMPFLDFTGARWEMLGSVRNLFRSDLFDGSIYDELLVVRPPTRVMGGVMVRF